MSYTSKFPTFEEIEQGHCVFTDSYFVNRNYAARWVEKLALTVVISHNRYFPVIKSVKIKRNRKRTTRLCFVVRLYDNIPRQFPYSEEGWNNAILMIKDEMVKLIATTKNILNEK